MSGGIAEQRSKNKDFKRFLITLRRIEMFNYPKTLEQAQSHKYEQWAGNPNGISYKKDKCAYAIYANYIGHQCSRKNGHGPNDLYCKQHTRKL